MLETCAVGCKVTSVCQNCGSRRFRADRALAGRLVCQSCGLATGSRPSRSRPNPRNQQRRNGASQLGRKRLLWLMLLIGVAIAVVVLTS
ncbi:putative zn-ribbon protein [Synechococcus sp. BOUM118]|nr:putative zn-ribbon protein [Synechococcus sp. BOUM118]